MYALNDPLSGNWRCPPAILEFVKLSIVFSIIPHKTDRRSTRLVVYPSIHPSLHLSSPS